MRAIVTTGHRETPLTLKDITDPRPAINETLVRVHAISLNRGEVRYAGGRAANEQIGWDFAGVVQAQASSGVGPLPDTRVVGFVWRGAWAEYIAAPANQLAVLPDPVTFEDAASLPVAAGTALQALRLGDYLNRKSILIAGASGGVGRFAVQLAAQSSATVTGTAGHADRAVGLTQLGADTIVIGNEPLADTYDLVIDMVGGDVLERILPHLTDNARVIKVGNASDAQAGTSDHRVQPMQLSVDTISSDLEFLAGQIAVGKLVTSVDYVDDWTNYREATARLINRQINGKAVLRVR